MSEFEKCINASDLIDWMMCVFPDWCEGDVRHIMDHVDKMPSVQPIVRCKDCKHGSPNGRYGCRVYHYKKYETHDMKPDDFCSMAERRENDAD